MQGKLIEQLLRELNFCNCGYSLDVLKYIRRFLIDLDEQNWHMGWQTDYVFLCFWANSHGYTRYNVNICNPYLTAKGKKLLQGLRDAEIH